MSDTTSVRYEKVVGNPHYTSITRSSSPVVEEDRSMSETFEGPIVNPSIGVEITAQTSSWPFLSEIALHLKKVCHKVYSCVNCQRQSRHWPISIRAKNRVEGPLLCIRS